MSALLYLFISALMVWSTMATGSIILRSSVTPGEAWVGQRVVLQVDVLGDSGWAQITRFGEIDLSGAYVIRTDSQGTRLQETIEGVSYTGQRYELSIYPQMTGPIEVPPIPVEVTTKGWGTDAAERVEQASSPAATVMSMMPPGADGIPDLISTTGLKATQQWEPQAEALKVGDALTRNVVMQAEDVSGMAFAPLQYQAIPGVGVYPSEPIVKDSSDRGALTGMRTEVVTYVLEHAGAVQLPDVELTWWNTADKTLELVKLPGLLLKVAAGPIGASDATGSLLGRRLETRVVWLPLILLLAVAYLLFRYRRGLVQRWTAWRKRREVSEVRVFKQAIKSLRSRDSGTALRDLMRWLDRINDDDRPARLDVFLRQYGDERTREVVAQGLHNTDLERRISDPSTLIVGLSAARERWRKAGKSRRYGSSLLPELN